MTENPNQLNAAQIQALQKQMAATTERILRDIELRKLALDHACQFSADGAAAVALARSMHEFLTAPAAEAKITIV